MAVTNTGSPSRHGSSLGLALSVLLAAYFVALIGRDGFGTYAAEAKKDYYKLLGILPTAKPAEIKKAYHKMSLKYHPDKNKEEGAEDMFMSIAEAYEVLSDEDRRRNYDNSGSGDDPGEDGEDRQKETSHEPMDIHLKFNGGEFRFKFQPPEEEKPTKAPDMAVTIDVELLDLYLGSEFNVTYTRQEVCHHCHGTGAEHKHDILPCPHCHGTGFRCSFAEQQGDPLGYFWQRLNTTCSKCEGTGTIINSTCSVCGGHKVILKEVTKTISVPPGAPDRWSVTLQDEGDQVPELMPGSVRVGLRVAEHAQFSRKDADLIYQANITLFEALLGFSMNITHLDNHTVEVQHDAVSSPGFSKVIINEGMPVIQGGGTYGDLIVMFDIEFPKRLDEEEKALLSSVLDEEELQKIEQMILKRSISENLGKLKKPVGHTLKARSGVESFSMVNMVDLSLRIPFHGALLEWSIFASQPGAIALQVWRPAPAEGDFPEHSYSLIGETLLEPEAPGLTKIQLRKQHIIICEEGDYLGWRVEADSLLPYDSLDDGLVRITKSPIRAADLGRTEHFPFSIARSYSLQAKVVSVALLFDERDCGGERVEILDDSVDFCSLRFLTGENVNDRVQSVLLPPGLRVQFFMECGATDKVDGPDIDNRASPSSECKNLPGRLSHIKLIRS